MAKISAYPSGSTPQDSDLFIIARSGQNFKLLWSALKTALEALFYTQAESDSFYQPKDSDLTAIAGLSPSNDDVMQRKAGAWTNRTMAQLATDLTTLAPLASPTFTGTPAAPTPADTDDSTKISTTEFVKNMRSWVPLPASGLTNTVAAGTTVYMPFFYYGLYALSYQFKIPRAGILKNLTFTLLSAQPVSGSLVLTVYKNGNPTTIVVTVAAGSAAGTYTDTAHVESVAVADTITLEVVNNAGAASGSCGATSLELGVLISDT